MPSARSLRMLGAAGAVASERVHVAWRWLVFGAEAVLAALTPATYTPAVRAAAARQVSASAGAVLPGFALACLVAGYGIVRLVAGTARDFGLAGYATDLYLRVAVLELLPLFVALFVALRSGAAIATEVALLRSEGRLQALRERGADPLRAELLPRGIGIAAAVASLTAVGAVLLVAVAYAGLYGFSPWGHDPFARAVGHVFAPVVLAGFAVKVACFAVTVAVVPVAAGLEAPRRAGAVPLAAPRGLVGVFLCLALVEGASLALKYA